MKIFVDTNVLIDYVCKREPFFVPAKCIFAACFLKKIEIVISSLSIVNTIYIGKKYGSEAIKEKISALSCIINVADLLSETVVNSLKYDWKDYEDSLQYLTALNNNADCIITRNKKDFSKSSLPVYTADEFIMTLNSLA